MTKRTATNMDRATAAVEALQNAKTDSDRLAAAKALESAARLLRRELNQAQGWRPAADSPLLGGW